MLKNNLILSADNKLIGFRMPKQTLVQQAWMNYWIFLHEVCHEGYDQRHLREVFKLKAKMTEEEKKELKDLTHGAI